MNEDKSSNENSSKMKKTYNVKSKSLLTCDICRQTFKFKSRLQRHMSSHTNTRPFTCTLCDSSFFDSSLLKRHMLVHTRDFPFVCDLCPKRSPKRFYIKSDLEKHIKVHNGEKPYKCKDCNECFLYSKTLSRHRKTMHSGMTPYPCEMCDEKLSSYTQMIQHRKIHGEYKPFVCEICDKTFAKSVNLREHYSLHTGLKLYSCRVCGKSFGYPSSLRKHQSTTDACTNRLTRESAKQAARSDPVCENSVSVVVVESVNMSNRLNPNSNYVIISNNEIVQNHDGTNTIYLESHDTDIS